MNARYRPDATVGPRPPEHPLEKRALVEQSLVERALDERDRRAGETAAMLAAGARSVVRLSARLPASLRERGLADGPVARGAAVFQSACRDRRLGLGAAVAGDGALGPWRIWTSDAAPAELKSAALYVEEGSWLGQLLDIDVAAADGPVGRAALCLPPRTCVVCGAPAAACSGRAAHDPAIVEAAFAAILKRSASAHEPGSPGGSAVGADPSPNIAEIETEGGDTP